MGRMRGGLADPFHPQVLALRHMPSMGLSFRRKTIRGLARRRDFLIAEKQKYGYGPFMRHQTKSRRIGAVLNTAAYAERGRMTKKWHSDSFWRPSV
jgi:hypothetical protein